jgi:hypothetical protein
MHLMEEPVAIDDAPLLSLGSSPYAGMRWIQAGELQRFALCTGFILDHLTHRVRRVLDQASYSTSNKL